MIRVIVLMLSVTAFLGGCVFDRTDTQPPATLNDYIKSSTASWLDVRMNQNVWELLSSPNADWKQANTFDQLYDWFYNTANTVGLPSEMWDFEQFVNHIRDTSLYKQVDPSDAQLLSLLKCAIGLYKYVN